MPSHRITSAKTPGVSIVIHRNRTRKEEFERDLGREMAGLL